jgi:hypothetical protein
VNSNLSYFWYSDEGRQLARAVPNVLVDPVRTVLSKEKMVPLRVVSSDRKEIDCKYQGGINSVSVR